MTLTASDVVFLSKSLSRWEIGEYICAGLVTIACAGEYVADFTNWFTGGITERKERLAKRSTLLLIAALSLELICLVRTNQLSGYVIGSLGDKAEDADRKARVAITDSSTALSQAKDAKTSAEGAADAASRAKVSAQHANDQAQLAKERTKEVSTQDTRLNWYALHVMRQINPRYLNFNTKRFVDFLKGKPKGTAEIWYVPGDLEAEIFAGEIQHALGAEGAGWDVARSKALPMLGDSDLKIGKEATLLGELRLMASEGLSVAAETVEPSSPDSPGRLFLDALDAGLPHINLVIQEAEDRTLPKRHVVIVVGHHNIRVPLLISDSRKNDLEIRTA